MSLTKTRLVPMVVCALASAAGAQVPIQTAMLEGRQYPSMPDGVYYGSPLSSAFIDNTGMIGVGAFLAGPGTTSADRMAVLTGAPGAMSIAARLGSAAPLGGPGAVYESFGPPVPSGGHVAFQAYVRGPGATGSANFAGVPGSLSPLAYFGQQAPGLAPGVTFWELGRPAQNNGSAAFFGRLIGPGIDGANSDAIWAGAPGSIGVVARTGEQAAGMGAGVHHTGFDTIGPAIGAGGHLLIAGDVGGPGIHGGNDNAVWVGLPGQLQLAIREGAAAPGAGAGVTFAYFRAPRLNASGQIVAGARVIGAGVTPQNDRGIWAGAAGSLSLAARTGSQAPGAEPGTLFTGFGSEGTPLIDDAGRIAFRATTAGPDGTGHGLWHGTPGDLHAVALSGRAAPGAGGATFAAVRDSFFINNAGQIAFEATLAGDGIGAGNDEALWAGDASGLLSMVVREGDLFAVSPGDERTVLRISLPELAGGPSDGHGSPLNDRGELVFRLVFTDSTEGLFLATIPAPSSLLPLLLVGAAASRRRR